MTEKDGSAASLRKPKVPRAASSAKADERPVRLAELKKSVCIGSYRVPADQLAEKLVDRITTGR